MGTSSDYETAIEEGANTFEWALFGGNHKLSR